MKKQLLFAYAAIAMVSCTAVPTPEPDNTPSQINFSAVVADVDQTKVAGTTFDDADKINVYSDVALVNGKGSTDALEYLGKTGAAVSDSWFWKDAVSDHTFYAYHAPKAAALTTPMTVIPVPDISVQATETATKTLADLKSDFEFLLATPVTSAKKATEIEFEMNRVFAAIQFDVKLKDGSFASNAAPMTSFKLTSTNDPLVNGDDATISLVNGNFAGTKNAKELTVAPAAPWALNNSTATEAAALILPQTGTVSVVFTVDGKDSAPVELSVATFEAGKVYVFSVTLNAKLEAATMGTKINDWSSESGDPIAPEV